MPEAAGSRQQLGRELRKLRLMAGMSGTELAQRLGITQTRVSRVETAAYRPDAAVVRSWLSVTGASAEVCDELLKLAGAAQVEAKTWRAVFRGSMAGRQQALVAQDAVAARVRHFQPFMPPGFTHTRAYAEAALRAMAPNPQTADVAAAVEARLARGERLRSSQSPPYAAIVTELALRWRPVGMTTEQIREQLRQVVDVIERSAVDLRVIPADAPMVQAPMSAFVLYDYADGSPSTVDIELPGVELRFAGQDEIAAWNVAWDRMEQAATSTTESAKIVTRLINEVEEGGTYEGSQGA